MTTERVPLCPHCRLWHDGRIITHCPDRDRWTQQERDALRLDLRRRLPLIVFAPSAAQMQDRFGERNRADAQRSISGGMET